MKKLRGKGRLTQFNARSTINPNLSRPTLEVERVRSD
jgi:hypothetical protein